MTTTSKWVRLEGLSGALSATVGRTVVRRTTSIRDVPQNGGFMGGCQFDAVQVDDGSWLVIEHQPAGLHGGEMTPPDEAATAIWWYGPKPEPDPVVEEPKASTDDVRAAIQRRLDEGPVWGRLAADIFAPSHRGRHD